MARLAVLVACAVLLACDSDRPTKPLESPAKAKPAAPAKVETTSKPEAPPKPEPPKLPFVPPPKDFLAELAAKPHPSLVGPFAVFTLDPMLTIGTAKPKAPHLFETMRKGSFTGPYVYTSSEWPGVEFQVDALGQIDSGPDAWIVESLQAAMPKAGVADRLKTAWGEPKIRHGNQTWLASDVHLRADLRIEDAKDDATLTLQIYTPLDTLIGTDPKLFGFEAGAPILGAKGADLMRRFGRRIVDYHTIVLPPIEHGPALRLDFADSLELGEEDLPDHVVRGWSLEIRDDRVPALLEQKLGTPKPDRDNENVKIYRKSPRITFDGSLLVVGEEPGY